jgi:hypothetical protein
LPPGFLTVVSVVRPVSEALLHAEVWVVVVEVFQPLEGESVVVVVPQSFVLAAWAGARPNAAAIAVANATRTRFVALDVMADCPPK